MLDNQRVTRCLKKVYHFYFCVVNLGKRGPIFTLLLRVSMPVHPQRDIVLPIASLCPSVCLSNAGTVCR